MVDGAGADLDLAVLLANAGKARDARDVDEQLRLAEPELHQRNEAVAAGDELGVAVGGAEASPAHRRARLRVRSRMRSGSRLASPSLRGP